MSLNTVEIIKTWRYEHYILHQVKPTFVVEYGLDTRFYCLELEQLVNQFNISKGVLEAVVSFSLDFKDAIYRTYEVSNNGLDKLVLIHADVMPKLIKRLKDTGHCPKLNTINEINMVENMIQTMKEVRI